MAAKIKNNGRKKKSGGIVNLKIVIEKLQKSLSLAARRSHSHSNYNNAPADVSVPEDVKEGHFAVIAIGGDEQPHRYVVALSYLTHPAFRRLLEEAAEEYGFDHEGALTVPCRPDELESILAQQQWKHEDRKANAYVSTSWGSCQTVVKSC